MKVMSIALLVLALVFSAPTLGAQDGRSARAAGARLVGYLSGVDVEGSGCGFRLAGERRSSSRYIFFEDFSDEAPYMNIGGKNVRLRLVSSSEPSNGAVRKGQRFSRSYIAGEVRVGMRMAVTSVCAPNDEQCEYTGYRATITVSKGGRRQTVRAVGGCGS
jgi:hypothetical protein